MRRLEALFAIWLAAVGLSIGSFLNVVIARLPHGESIVRPRSKCPRCQKPLAWYDNIPLVSFLVLGGRCRACGVAISARYFLVELLTGALFLGALVRFGWTWHLVSALTLITLLVPLVFIDAEHWVLPFELTLPGLALGVILHAPLGWSAIQTSLIGLGAAFVLFRLMEFAGWLATGKEALGGGDKYLLALVGAFLGWRALPALVLFSSLQGSVISIVRLSLTGRAGPTPEEPPGASPGAHSHEAEVASENASPVKEDRQPFSPAFMAPGLAWWKRLALIPYTLLIQEVPDPLLDEETGDDLWEPQPNNLPFGPWIGLAALELLLLGPWLAASLRGTPLAFTARLLLG